MSNMNRTYRLVWNSSQRHHVAAPGTARGCSQRGAGSGLVLAAAVVASLGTSAHAAPAGGSVSAGSGSIATQGSATMVTQSSQNLAINWNSFGIAQGESVTFVQPNASAIALNRVLGSDASQIYGRLSANGRVFLLNPNGILFGKTAQVSVGGLVATTLGLSDADFLAGKRTFAGGGGAVVNQGEMTAPAGYIAFLGARASNQGSVQAQLGTVVLAAGRQVTLDFAGDKLLSVQVDRGALNALAENRQLIRADGGTVVLSARAADALVTAVVNNTGVIQARTLHEQAGVIRLMGDMQSGEVRMHGTLDASAPSGGNGGFVETSAAQVKVGDDARVTTRAPHGRTGTWLIDPQEYLVAASGGDITGAALSSNLATTDVSLQSSAGAAVGSGNVNVNDAVSWSANTRLTLTASNNVNINAPVTASGAGAGITISPNTANGAEAASGTGSFNLGPGGVINLPHVSPDSTTSLVIAGSGYTVINSLGTAGDSSGTTLQGLNAMEFDLVGTPHRVTRGGHFALGSNIDASATGGWNGGAGFAPPDLVGVLDGLGHTISGLVIHRPTEDSVGLTSAMVGSIRNVGLVNVSVVGNGTVGGLVGVLDYGSSITNSYTTGGVASNLGVVGGLAGGANDGSLISSSYSTSSVQTPGGAAGGLVGTCRCTIVNSYATGNVTGSGGSGGLVGFLQGGSVVRTSYATGSVSASADGTNGGLAGVAGGAAFDKAFWNTQTSGTSVAVGSDAGGNFGSPIGLTTAQLLQQGSFTGWDFADTWIIYNGATNPLLRSFMTPLTVTAHAAVKTYDGLAYAGGNGVSYSSAPSANLLGAVSYGGNSQGAVDAGLYTLVPGGLYSNQQGYIISYAPGTLTTHPAALTVTASDASKTYGQTASLISFGSSGLQNGETIGSVTLASLGATAAANAGTYPILPGAASGGSFNPANYTIAYAPGTLTVDPATLVLTADPATRTYGAANPVLSGQVSGFVNADTLASATSGALSFSTSASPTSSVGNYAIIGTGLSANHGNYVFVQAPANANALSITPATPAAAASDASKVYGQGGTLSAEEEAMRKLRAAAKGLSLNIVNGGMSLPHGLSPAPAVPSATR